MTLHVIRHASAGARDRFGGNDLDRPLDGRGRDQSFALADVLGDRPIVRLVSSEALRCTQTLGPMAARFGLPVETDEALTEGASAHATVELLRELAVEAGDVALCSHGDVIPAALSSLLYDGMVVIGSRGCDKGSIWELETRGRDIVSARYRSAPSLSRDLAAT